MFIAVVFLGLSFSVKQDGHIVLEVVRKYVSPKLNFYIEIVIHFSGIIVFSIITCSAIITTIKNFRNVTPTLSIPFWLFFLPTILGFCLLSIVHVNALIGIIKESKSGKNK